jgi:hypothetical protein
MRYIVEPHVFGLWHVRDTEFDGPGSVFSSPVVQIFRTNEGANEAARRLNLTEDRSSAAKRKETVPAPIVRALNITWQRQNA